MTKDEVITLAGMLDKEIGGVSGSNQLVQCFIAHMPELHQVEEVHKNGNRRKSMSILCGDGIQSMCVCFACGTRGSISGLVKRMSEIDPSISSVIDYIESCESMAAEDVILRAQELAAKKNIFHTKEAEKFWDAKILDKYSGGCPTYILERGISLQIAKRFEVGFDAYGNRAVFPVREGRENELVGMVGRSLFTSDEQHEMGVPKYKNYKLPDQADFEKTNYLYGENLLSRDFEYLILVEGMIDTMLVYQSLEKFNMNQYAVLGIFGNRLSDKQIDKIVRWTDKVIPMFDNDSGGKSCQEWYDRKVAPRVKTYAAKWSLKDAGEVFEEGGEESIMRDVNRSEFRL